MENAWGGEAAGGTAVPGALWLDGRDRVMGKPRRREDFDSTGRRPHVYAKPPFSLC